MTIDMAVGLLCLTTACAETLNDTILGVDVCSSLPVPKVTPKIVPFSQTKTI